MGFYRIALLITSLLVSFSSSKEYVPALLFGSIENNSDGVGVSALSKLTGDDFREYLLKLVDNNVGSRPPILLVFAEESLSVEDFSWASVGEYGLYPRLMNITRPSNSAFIPAVNQPLKALESLIESGYKWKKYTPTQVLMTLAAGKDKMLPQVNQDTKGIVLYVDMEDANPSEDRPDMLRRHDTFIADTFEKFKGDREVIVVYTANHSSWYDTHGDDSGINSLDSEDEDYVREIRSSARRLLAEPNGKGDESYIFYNANNSIILYSDTFPVLYNGSDSLGTRLNGSISVTLDSRNSQMSQKMFIKYQTLYVSLRIAFVESKRKYWNLTQIDLSHSNSNPNSSSIILIPSKHIEAPIGFSYHCSQSISFIGSGGVRVVFEGLQVQPFLKGDKIAFGDGYDCVYFFTAPIWSGLFVTFLLGLILIWGLSMIMSIRTMDRFDDPKGKTITIGLAE